MNMYCTCATIKITIIFVEPKQTCKLTTERYHNNQHTQKVLRDGYLCTSHTFPSVTLRPSRRTRGTKNISSVLLKYLIRLLSASRIYLYAFLRSNSRNYASVQSVQSNQKDAGWGSQDGGRGISHQMQMTHHVFRGVLNHLLYGILSILTDFWYKRTKSKIFQNEVSVGIHKPSSSE